MITARFAAIVAAACTVAALWPATPCTALSDSRRLSPAPGHLAVDLPRAPRGPQDPLVAWSIAATYGTTWSRIPPYAAYLQRRGSLPLDWRPRWDQTVLLTVAGQLYRPAATQARSRYGGGSITFAYSGWTTTERQQLSAYVNAAYPVIQSIYGAPASTITVTIVRDPQLQDVLGGVYLPATNEIRLPPIQDFSRDTYVLASLMVRAFHDDLYIAYDAWETGFARAVALVAHLQVDADFDLRGEPYYLLPVYELLNQRPLASPNFLPASGYLGMTFWRIGMAQAAWLKVYAENPNFFADFNAAYYAEFDPGATPPLSQNVTRLRQIAAAAAPQVEGMLFQDWFARQFVLDTDTWRGHRLYLAALPQVDNISVYLEAEYYWAKATGDEQPLNASGSFQFIGWSGRLYTPEAGTTITIQNGQGFLTPSFYNIGGAQRITVELAAGTQLAEAWFPYGAASQGGIYNEYFGVVIDADGGTVNVMPPGIPTTPATVTRGVFWINQEQALDFLAQTAVEYQPPGAAANLRLVNTGFLYHVFVLRAYPLQTGTVQRTLPGGLSMMALPVSPDESDAADILRLPPGQTLLSRWSATVPGGYRYIFYPNTPPIEPGLGYWLKLSAARSVTAHGLLPAGEYRLHLRQGWHQVANPFRSPVPLSGVRVKYLDQAPITLAQAQAQGIVGTVWRYSAGAYVVAQQLPPYEGVWIYVYPTQGCWLIIQEP